MSTLHEITEFTFHNRKPSITQVRACIKNALKDGSKAISISWGENMIELTYHDNAHCWYGYGWIKSIGGSNLADEMNKANAKRFVSDHFSFVHIGA